MTKMGDGSGSMAADHKIHPKGMKTHSAEGVDASMKLGKASVNDGATRSETAPTPKTLGERTA